VLKAAFVQGRLDKDELDARVGQALASQTYAELAALTADIPAEPALHRPARVPNQTLRRHPIRNGAIGVGVSLTVAAAFVWFAFILQNQASFVLVLLAGALVMFGVPLIIWDAVDIAWQQRRSRRQLPPRPGHDDQVPGGQRDRAIGRDTTRPGARPDRTRAELRSHGSQARPAIRPVPVGFPV
jgi:hypothetical protein